jgi:beta-hydroxylase
MAALSLKIAVVSIFLSSALFVHFRGHVKHRVRRQLTDHSTFLAPYNALMYLFSAVPLRPYQDVNAFPELERLRSNWTTIRDEALALYTAGHLRAAEKYNDIAFNTFFRRGWKRFHLKWYGDPLPSARMLCPQTVDLLNAVPSINAALFALLPAGAKLGEHRDPFAGSLRFHLGLVTPNSDKCCIVVDGTQHAWRDGESVIFDETFIHSAFNNTESDRIILFCDVTRPLRGRAIRAINQFMIDHVVKATATRNEANEPLGIVNHVSKYVYKLKLFFEDAKKINKRLYYGIKYVLIIGLLIAIFHSALGV